MKNKLMIILSMIFFSLNTSAISFKEVVDSFGSHEGVEFITRKAYSIKKDSQAKGSWGDPIFKVAAKNYPKNSLKNDVSPMTGIEFGVSQKISLTTKYGNIKKHLSSISKSIHLKAKDKKEILTKSLWEVVITRKKVQEEVSILKENLNWIIKILKVSKRLYANGKNSQQAVLDIQIRRSEIESSLSNKHYEILQLDDKLLYLIRNKKTRLNYNTIPWGILTSKKSQKKDYRELSLKEIVRAKKFNLTASRLNYIPDLTVGLAYTKRSNINNEGDFVSAVISFPLPFSGKKYGLYGKAAEEKYSATKEFKHYRRRKKRNSSILFKEIKKLQGEILIITNKTIKYAHNSRTITSKSYGLGNSTYVELLQSELNLQKFLLKKSMLVAKRDIKKITLKYILGEALYE